MNVSFNGIGQWCATFLAGEISEGSVVKVSDQGTAAACAAGDAFCGVAVAGGKGACTVQMGGFVTVPYSDTVPTLGYTGLAADGTGGVKTSAEGTKYWVVASDSNAKTVTILL